MRPSPVSASAILTAVAAGNVHLRLGDQSAIDAVLNAGTYQTSAWAYRQAQLGGASARNYVLPNLAATNTAPTFTVNPRAISGALTVPASIVYGDAPKIAVDFTNVVGSAPTDYSVTATLGTTVRTFGRVTALPANLAVGTQQLGVSLAGLSAFNYLLASPITGEVSITPKAVTIDPLVNSVTYGLATGALFGINGMVVGDDVAPLVSLSGDTAARATTLAGGFGLPLITRDVGTYATTIAALAGSAAGNYTLTPYTGSLGVTPKTITYTSDGFAAQYGFQRGWKPR